MTDAPTTNDPVELAMEAEAHDAAPDSPARRLLLKQERLVGWQIASERASFVLKLLTGLACVAAVAAVVLMAWTASRADGLVVEPFAVPPQLAERGLSGAVVAGEVLDQLNRLNSQSVAIEVVRLSDSWSADSHVEIPQTGVSIDEVNRLLRRWLGHQTFVTGTLVLTGDGVELSARTGGGRLVRAEGPVADLKDLAGSVAEQLLADTTPVQYARLLMQRERFEEAWTILNRVIATSTSRRELAQAHSALGGIYQVQARPREARDEMARALQLGYDGVLANLANMERALGHAQAALDTCRRALAGDSLEKIYKDTRLGRTNSAVACALMDGDFRSAERQIVGLIGVINQRGYSASGRENHIWALSNLHQTSAARAEIPAMMATPGFRIRLESFRVSLAARIAAQEEDWPTVLALLAPGQPAPTPGQLEAPTPDAWRALALAKLGRVAEARAMAATLPADCYRCLRTRAEVAEAAGDRAGADRWFAEAVRQAPRLPFAETDWARVLLSRGDARGAAVKARAASRKQPAFADARVVWGEALLAAGDPKGAAATFAAAERHAPHWGRLHLKWGQALARLGKAQEARAQWARATRLDLTTAERAELARVLR